MADKDEILRQEVWVQARVNTLGMKFALINPGTFTMGPDKHRIANVQKAHQVEISQGYFISVTEITNTQFRRLFPEYTVDAEYSPDRDSPAVSVSWDDAHAFCKLLSEKEGAVYRLPTEAEWEYACRAGSTTHWSLGLFRLGLDEYGWCEDSTGRASRVAALKPNEWGIYDMRGNVLEWVSDWYSDTYYAQCASKGVVHDPIGPAQGWSHVLRSGAWLADNPMACTCTTRFPLPIFDRVPFSGKGAGFRQVVGFRVVRELPGDDESPGTGE
ncbi:MAG: formylglycine-generating enzyme family protein [Phycisphaerae bacterium]|nr:formylglycine-generating enzyme family protein [Phycisphaerae bacterium]